MAARKSKTKAEKRKYHLAAEVLVSTTTTVYATSAEEAMKIARGRGVEIAVGFAIDDSKAWLIEDGDGEPVNIQVESEEPDDGEEDEEGEDG